MYLAALLKNELKDEYKPSISLAHNNNGNNQEYR